MKFTVAYYLLLFYAAAMLKPVMPLISDFLAHRFAHEHHMATVHHHHGENHVHEELAAAADEQDEKQQPKQKMPDPVSVHTLVINNFEFYTWLPASEYNIDPCPEISKPLLQIIIPPPRIHFS